jgi:lipopolysaccharide/colanic/teichoic acid biosynthesis glycosyltransferase
MKRNNLLIIVLDMLIVTASYACILYIKSEGTFNDTEKYFKPFFGFIVTWFVISSIYGKYNSIPTHSKLMNRKLITSNFLVLALLIIVMYATRRAEYSRLVVFGIVFLSTVVELFVWGFMNKFSIATPGRKDYHEVLTKGHPVLPVKTKREVHHFRRQIIYSLENVKSYIINDKGERVYQFFANYINPVFPKTLVVSTTTKFNIDNQPDDFFQNIVNLKRVNDIRYINKFFEAVNAKIPDGGMFIGCAETKNQRKVRILLKYPRVINFFIYSLDFIVKRIFPKFPFTKKIYFFLTRGENRVLSRAEILGRLVSCGFEVRVEKIIEQNYYFVAYKKQEPCFDMDPTYGVFVSLPRLGKNGKWIKVYKFRTMHPYSEYLQDYIYLKHDLAEGGKFDNDFRISNLGRFLRTFWLDELPMVINLFRGELKLVGVRPLSLHYFSLYSRELQRKRIKYKPGLIPPFYADLPKTLEEIMASEMKYLEAYEKNPFSTDWKYFWKAVYNIVFRKVRSN